MELYVHEKKIRLRHILLKLTLLLIPFAVSAQNQTDATINSKLYGKVLDSATRQPIIGAVIRIQGTTHSVASDQKGEFKFITGQRFPYILVVTFVGYITKQITATGSPVNILLKENQAQL